MPQISAAERFAKAAAALKSRDLEDKRNYQERKRQKAQEKRAKQKARDAEEQAAEEMVSLGPGLGFPGEEKGGRFPIFRVQIDVHLSIQSFIYRRLAL